MNKLLTAFVVGFVIIGLTGCPPPPPLAPTFDLADGTYGYSLDMTDPMAPVPVLQAVGIEASDPANVIFYTLDGSTPVAWDPTNPADPNYNMAGLATLSGSIPYIDMTSPECLAACAALPPEDQAECYAACPPDLTTFTSVGTLYFMGLLADPPAPGPATVTIKAIAIETAFGQSSPIAEATYTIDPTIWNGDYTVVGHPPLNPMDPMTADIPLQVLMGLLSAPPAGGGFTTIDGNLTITSLSWADALGVLYGCHPQYNAPGCLGTITGDLTVTNNANTSTTNIEAMAAGVVVGGSVTHCSNADDDPCPEDISTVNLCEKSADCATPPDEGEWACDEGGDSATVAYTPEGATLKVQVSGTVPLLDEDYTLIYYPDPWAVANGNLICLASDTSDATTGAIAIPWTSADIGEDLPIPADDNTEAKILLLPTANVNCGTKTISWSGDICSSLWEVAYATDRITYTYTP